MSIAYKKSLEAKYWLNLLRDSDFIGSKNFESILADADELSKMLFTTIRSTRILKSPYLKKRYNQPQLNSNW